MKEIELFRAGDYGDKGNWTAADIAKVAANYDPALHEAPVVLGHPDSNAPAYGWIESLRAEGGKLYGTFKQLHQGFVDAVKEGRFKHRSVQLYKNLEGRGPYLRHVGFLGAMPPHVKGLAPVEFKEGESVAFEFADGHGMPCPYKDGGENEVDETTLNKTLDTKFAGFLESFTEKLKSIFSSRATPIEGAAAPLVDVKAEIAAAVDAAKASFSDELTKLKTDLENERKANAAARVTSKVAEIRSFVEAQTKAGKFLPAWKALGLVECMESLASAEATVEFGEEGKKTKKAPLEIFQSFLESLPTIVNFKELTASATAGGKGNLVAFNDPKGNLGVEGMEEANAIKALQTKDPKLSFEEARAQYRTAKAG